MEHVPTALAITEGPAETVQTPGVFELNTIARPDVALALSGTGVELTTCVAMEPKVILCVIRFVTRKACVTGAAPAKIVLPVWVAVMEQVPSATNVTVFPESVQTERVLATRSTVSPESAVTLIENDPDESCIVLIGAKLIVCNAWLRVNV